MTKVILDTSALLALINEEPGKDVVIKVLPNALMSSVNVAEIVSFLGSKHGIPIEDTKILIQKLIEYTVDFSAEHAYLAGELNNINITHKLGLSLGDRACLATAMQMDLPVYTADKVWSYLEIKNLDIQQIR